MVWLLRLAGSLAKADIEASSTFRLIFVKPGLVLVLFIDVFDLLLDHLLDHLGVLLDLSQVRKG